MFSVLPLALERPMVGLNLVSLPVKDNPYFVQLGSGTTDTSGEVLVPLSPVFESVLDGWRAVATPPTTGVSLQLDATYVSVQGSNASFYHYYDQVPYDPFVPVAVLSVSFVLDLTTPYATGPIVASPASTGVNSTGGCSKALSTSWSTVAFSVQPGDLPLATLVDNVSVSSPAPLIISDAWGPFSTAEFGFGGVQSAFPGLVEASVDPSWTGVIPNFLIQGAGAIGLSNATTPLAVPMIVLTGATYLVVGQVEKLHWVGGEPCSAFNLNVTFVSTSVPLAVTWLPACSGAGCYGIFYSLLGTPGPGFELEALSDRVLLNSTSLNIGASLQFRDQIRNEATYRAALAAEGSALNTTLVFSLNLGEAVLTADAAVGCYGACSTNSSAAADGYLLAQFGPAFQELASQGAYAFASQTGASSGAVVQQIVYGLEAARDSTPTVSLFLYGGATPTYLDVGGTLYPTSVPDLGPIACSPTAAPGAGC